MGSKLSSTPPPSQNSSPMACPNRFLGFHTPNSLLPSWPYRHLFIGTFNPAWNFPTGENAPYFYGRTRNNYFWDLLPALWGTPPLRQQPPTQWIAFLKAHAIGLSDIIRSIQDANPENPLHRQLLYDKSDATIVKHFKAIQWNTPEILQAIATSPPPRGVLITNRKGAGPIEKQFKLIENACIARRIPFRRLVTPSGNARFHFPKGSPLYPSLLTAWATQVRPLQ